MAKATVLEYATKINDMKVEAHNKNWLYIEFSAKELIEMVEPGSTYCLSVCKAMYDALLEGDEIQVKPATKSGNGLTLQCRYYVDNLAETRRKYSEVC